MGKTPDVQVLSHFYNTDISWQYFRKEETDMKEQILVMGGSYFAGRVFGMIADAGGYAVTVINRGTYSVKDMGNIRELVCDRHDRQKLKELPIEPYYDAVVDFCAYHPGDIETIVSALPCKFHQYVFISTADVAEPDSSVRNERSALRQTAGADPVEQYTFEKKLLEEELRETALRKNFTYTTLRPAFIYGPYNYAPRESWFIQRIVQGHDIPYPVDAKGRFQMVYVKDVARAVLLCIGNRSAYGNVYLLSAPEIMTYDSFLAVLRDVSGRIIRTRNVTVAEVTEQRIPLPFPLTEQENALFDGSKIERELGFSYCDQREAMRLTWNAFRAVFEEI